MNYPRLVSNRNSESLYNTFHYKYSKNVKLITAKRKNQLIRNTPVEKAILKKRYTVENIFAKIKQFNRIHIIRD